jgi:hypothetical protein
MEGAAFFEMVLFYVRNMIKKILRSELMERMEISLN